MFKTLQTITFIIKCILLNSNDLFLVIGSLGLCRIVEYVVLKPVQQAMLVGLTRPFLRRDKNRVAHAAFASGEIQKSCLSQDGSLIQTFFSPPKADRGRNHRL